MITPEVLVNDLDQIDPLPDTKEKLDYLVELRTMDSKLNAAEQELIDELLTPEIRKKIADIRAEFTPKRDSLTKRITAITSEIKEEVIGAGETIQGAVLEATFCKGRVTWDSKGLNKAIELIPQLEQYRKHGNPYVTIRARKQK